jgi:hypothetical protein
MGCAHPAESEEVAMKPVATMSLYEKFTEVVCRMVPRVPGAMGHEFRALLQPATLGVIVGGLVLWAGSHAAGGFGFVCDALLVGGGVALLGLQAFTAASALGACLGRTVKAQSEPDLDAAAGFLAEFAAIAGMFFLTLLVGKGVRKAAPAAGGAAAVVGRRLAGMLPEHFEAVRKVAQQMNVIIAFRITNPLAAQWIRLGFPGKPISVKAKSSKTTGIVTTATLSEALEAHQAGYYIVDAAGVPRNAAFEPLELTKCEWPLELGQVVDGTLKKPLVGDYDLLGVIEPGSPGRNIVLAVKDNVPVKNRTNPRINAVAEAINRQLDRPRVLHGAWDGFDEASTAGEVTVFFPDGTVTELTTAEQIAAWYTALGRKSILAPKNQ